MNIVLINHYAGSKTHGMEYRPYYLAREWVKLGHQVTILAASFSHLRIKNPLINGAITEDNVEGIRYVWLKTPKYSGNGVGRVVNIFTFVARLFRDLARITRDRRPDAVIASSTYPLDIYPAYRIAKKSNARLVFEVHDLWPLTLIELGGMSRRHPFVMLLQMAENFAYRKADRVVSMLPKAERHMREHHLAPHKFVHIPNGIDVAEWQAGNQLLPREHALALQKLNEDDRFVVAYAGGHGVSNALDTMMEAARQLPQERVVFVLVGQGPEKSRLQEKARQLGLTNVLFLPPVPKPAIPGLLGAMDALYIGWNKRPIYRFGISPNKLLDYMMAAKPVIHAVEAANDPVAESGCGASCVPEDAAAVAGAVSDLMSRTPDELKAMGERGRDYVTTHHEYAFLARRFVDVLG